MKTTPLVRIRAETSISKRKIDFTLNQIKTGFYQNKGYFLTDDPNIASRFHKSVYLPKRLIQQLSAPVKTPELDLEVSSVSNFYPKPHFIKMFVHDVEDLFNNKIKLININVSPYGVKGSFSPQINGVINLSVRQDIRYRALFSLIISSILMKEDTSISYEDRMKITNTLLDSSFLKKYERTQIIPETSSSKIINKSNQLYATLGYPTEKIFCINGEKLNVSETFSGKLRLSSKDKAILFKLAFRDELVTYDELGQILWKDYPETFSLEAINKYMSRLKTRIKLAGIRKEIIFCERSEGYKMIG